MAQIFYELDGTSTNYVYFTTSYNETTNQTTVTFGSGSDGHTWHKIWRNEGADTYVTTGVSVTPTDNTGEKKSTSVSFMVEAGSGRAFYDPDFNQSKIIVQHSFTAGDKYVNISAYTSTSYEYGSGSTTVKTGTYTYGEVGNPSSPKIQVNGIIIPTSYSTYRDTTLTLNWTAAANQKNNEVVGYRLHYALSGQSYSQFIDIGKVTTYSFKIMDNFGGPRKGTTFQLGIQALAKYGGLNSSIVSFGTISIINKPPERPTFSTSGIVQITTGKDTEITVTNLVGKDVDDDPITYYYAISNVSNATSLTETVLPLNKKIKMNPTNCYLYIRAKETSTGVASEWNCIKATVNIDPEFKILYSVSNQNQVASKNNTSIKYANILSNVKCQVGTVVAKTQKITWQIGTEVQYDKAQITEGQTVYNLGNYKVVPVSEVNGGGKKIKIKAILADEAGDTFIKEQITDFYRLYEVMPESLEIYPIEQPTAEVSSRFLNNIIKAQVNINLPVNDVQRTLKFYRGQLNQEGEWIYTLLEETFNVDSNGKQIYQPIESKIQYDTQYRFRVGLNDHFGNETYYTSDNYWRLPLFNVTEGSFSFSQKEWHPLKDYIDYKETQTGDPLVKFETWFADNIGEIGKNSYTIEAEYEGKVYELVSKLEYDSLNENWETSLDGNTITLSHKNIDLFKKLKRATNTPTFSITYKITGYNAFGERGATATFNGTIITQEPPENTNMKIVPFILSNAITDYQSWFNPEDQITFNIEKIPFDYNDLLIDSEGNEELTKSISNYIIYYKYKDDTEWRAPNDNWKDWKGNFVKDGEYLKEITIESMPPLSLNKDKTEITLGLLLIDDVGLPAITKDDNQTSYLTTNLVACRKEGIIFSINSASLDKDELSVNLQINDFGGNNLCFENFKRNGNETFKITLYVSLNDEEFIEYNTEIPYEEGVSASKVFNEYLNKTLKPFTTLNSEQLNKGKLYIKAKLDIITNSVQAENSIISATTATYLLYLSQPTMSHRSHWIGVNTTDKTDNEVFKISEYKDQKFIKLIGNYQKIDGDGNLSSPQEILISIDLKEGIISSTIDKQKGYEINMRTGQINVSDVFATKISGATISGGTW